jgi:hypothetical protein
MNFDTILHLSCEHAVPIYRSACQLKAARHIVAVAQEHASIYEHLQQGLPEGIHLEKVNVQTSEPDAYTKRLIKVIESLPPGRHALHLYGASRTVFTILWMYCRDKGIPCFFPDNETMAYRWANAGETQLQAFEPVIRKVNDFFHLSGYRLDEQRATDSLDQSIRNQAAALAVWEERDRIKTFSRNVRDFSKAPGKPFRINSQNVDGMTIAATLKQPKDGNQGRLILGDQKFVVRPWKDMASFLCGGWYRDALLKRIMEVKDSLGIVDIQTDCEITHEHPLSDMPTRYHIDIAYTDGKTLGLIQTLRRTPEIHHARNLRKTLNGLAHHSGKGVLCSLEDTPHLKETIACWPDTSVLSGIENVIQEL